MGIGDKGRPWTFVLLGATGAGKSALGNVLLEKETFKVGHTAKSCTTATNKQVGLIASIETPAVVIDTPGFGDSEGRDEQHMREMADELANEKFVNAFILVLNGTSIRCDDQIFNMLKAYIAIFGLWFFNNMIVVVTHWDMSKKGSNQRLRKEITQQSFQESWVSQLQTRLDTSLCDHIIPFVFIDTEVRLGAVDEGVDEEEKAIFEQAKLKIYEIAAKNSLFACLRVNTNFATLKKFQQEALDQGLKQCSKCKRYYYADFQKNRLTKETFASACITTMSTQGTIAAARILRVLEATEKFWRNDAVIKAMTRGWTANTGVHLFGRVASRAGTIVSVGVGAYRFAASETQKEKAQAILGTSAGLAGGYVGASSGAALGTAFLPGIGTVVGGVVGGLVGSFATQVGTEKCVAQIGDVIDSDMCHCCRT